MMRPHCDRCDKLCDETFPSWIEDTQAQVGHPSAEKAIWHIRIDGGGTHHLHDEKMFCRTCQIVILESHVKTLKLLLKCDGNHGGPRCEDPECWNQ